MNAILGSAEPTTLVALHHDEPVTTSLAVAEGTENEHRAVLQLVRKYAEDLSEFGGVAFEMRPFDTAGGKQHRELAYLNEPQATLLITYMRNTDVVRDFKKRLVRAFFELAVQRRSAQVPHRDEPLSLNHRADIFVAAERTFRSAVRAARAGGLRTPAALLRAQAITLNRTGVDMLAELDIPPPLAEPAAPDCPVAEFYRLWAEGALPIPCTVCRRSAFHAAFEYWWSTQSDDEPMEIGRFTRALQRAAGRQIQMRTSKLGGFGGVRSIKLWVPAGLTDRQYGVMAQFDSAEALRFEAALQQWMNAEVAHG